MATTSRHVEAPPEAVWAVLGDGWSYAAWVVGTSRIRDVDPAWPAKGSRIHHSFGLWPAVIDDETRVEESVPPSRLVLTARGWPMGEARVEITLRPEGTGTAVTIDEAPVSGPGLLGRNRAADWVIAKRNEETLLRLARIAEGRHH